MNPKHEYSLVLLFIKIENKNVSKILVFDGDVSFSDMTGLLSGKLLANYDKVFSGNSVLTPPINYEKKISDMHDIEIFRFENQKQLKGFCSRSANFGFLFNDHADRFSSFVVNNILVNK